MVPISNGLPIYNVIKKLLSEILIVEVKIMKVKEIMSKDVKQLCKNDSLEKASQLMEQEDIGSLPICEQNKVVGIVTDRDIALRAAKQGQNIRSSQVGDIMTSNPIIGSPEMDVNDAAKIMSDHQIRRLPIEENSHLVGVVSLGDISLEPSQSANAENTLKNVSEPNKPHY